MISAGHIRNGEDFNRLAEFERQLHHHIKEIEYRIAMAVNKDEEKIYYVAWFENDRVYEALLTELNQFGYRVSNKAIGTGEYQLIIDWERIDMYDRTRGGVP